MRDGCSWYGLHKPPWSLVPRLVTLVTARSAVLLSFYIFDLIINGEVFDLVFFEWSALWSAPFCLFWFPMDIGSSSFRYTSLLFGLCGPLKPFSKTAFGVSSSTSEELVDPALPLIFFGYVGVTHIFSLGLGAARSSFSSG